jgi:iron complex outermembrane receptor protein
MSRHPLSRLSLLALAIVQLGSISAILPAAHAAEPSSAAVQRSYSIPAGPLEAALNHFGREAGIMLSFSSSLTAGLQSLGLHGNYTIDSALGQLLQGTGLAAEAHRDRSYTLYKLPVHQGDTTLAPVTVTAGAQQESAWGAIKGYIAKRSATGTKTDTPIIETPQSITVIGAEEIETLKSQSLQDALGYIAGVNRAEGQDRTSDAFFLRGFKTGNSSVFRDGSQYVVNYYNGRQEPYGLERIELLKGAASVLYGAAAPGGLINTVSKRPTTETLHELNVELGSFARKQISGDFAGALDKESDWSYRFTFLQRDSDTAIDHVPDDRTYVAPTLKWQPDANTSLTLLAEYQKDHTVYIDGLPAEGTVLPNANGRISRTRFTGEPGYDKFKLERYSFGYLLERAFNEQWKLRHSLRYYHAQNEYDYTWGWGLSSDQRSTAFRGAQDRWDRSSAIVTDTSLQYQVTHGLFQHTMLAGIDYALPKHESERYNRDVGNLDYYSPVYGSALGAATPASFSWKSDMQRLGLYAQDQMKIADKWVVLLGGRQDYVRYSEKSFFTGVKTIDDEKSKAFSGRAGLVYLADNGLAPFLSCSESFEPTDGSDRQGKRFKPTTGKQYEVGLRYQPKGSDTLVSATAYQLTQDNVLVSDPVDNNFSIQSGRVRSRGFELEARTRLGRHGNLIAAYAYTDARTLKASPLQPEQEGQRASSAPYNQVSLWGDYSLGEFGLPGIKVGAGVRYIDEMLGQAQGTTVTLPSFTLIDAMISYKTGPWKFALNITNLTDKTYIASCTYGCFYGEPRKAIVSANYRW